MHRVESGKLCQFKNAELAERIGANRTDLLIWLWPAPKGFWRKSVRLSVPGYLETFSVELRFSIGFADLVYSGIGQTEHNPLNPCPTPASTWAFAPDSYP